MMDEQKIELMYGSLLHDIGKILYRSGFGSGTHSKRGWEFLKSFEKFKMKGIRESILYHHFRELKQADLANNSSAFITYIADNIASGVDRRGRVEEGDTSIKNSFSKFDKEAPLKSVFNVLHKKEKGETNGSFSFVESFSDFKVRYPENKGHYYSSGQYSELKERMTIDLSGSLEVREDYINSLLQWTESLWQGIPSSTNTDELMDISLYDHSKMTMAIATCIYDYLSENEISDYKNELFSPYDKTKAFYEKEVFVLLSMDMSGVQDFIYNISGESALKSLRARSFYLEFLLEVVVDELLQRLELSRANLLYTGGGHSYLLLPNTKSAREQIAIFESELKQWFLDEFTTDLSLIMGYVPCSGKDFMKKKDKSEISDDSVWRRVSQKLSEKKLHKYTAKDILALNQNKSHDTRECSECLRSDKEIYEVNGQSLCEICASLIRISADLRDNHFFIVKNTRNFNHNTSMKLPFNYFFAAVTENKAQSFAGDCDVVRIYSKNKPYTGNQIATNLWMGDYDFAGQNTEDKSLTSYVKREGKLGIKRLGVLRADVDNLGVAFISGIEENYRTISRVATFSRQLSLFFKYEINQLLEGSAVSIIYAGGDDMFLIGEWDAIIERSLFVREKFKAFTMNKLTFSAGIGLYPAKYPISKMAEEVGELEETAKTIDNTKDKLALWIAEKDHAFNWNEFKEKVLQEKVEVLRTAFNKDSEHGKTYLYKLLQLIRETSEINIARLAYLIARSNVNDEAGSLIFQWARDQEERRYLITAIEYYVYKTREG